MKKNKVIILASIIVGVLVVTLGLTYAAITFNETKGNSELVLGDIWMRYGETNQLVLNDAMPMDINTYKVNPVMASQELNELSRCVNYLNSVGVQGNEGESLDIFCQGTGTFFGATFQETLDNGGFPTKFLTYFEENNIILVSGDSTYIVNPIIASQEVVDNELSRCIEIYTNWGYHFDEGIDAESFCKGTGTSYGDTIQEDLDLLQEIAKLENIDFLKEVGQELLDSNIIIPQIENLPYFEFTIDGKNTYAKKDIWYEIVLNHGDNHTTRTTRIRDDLLKFTLVEVIDENEIVLRNNIKFNDLRNKRIWVDTIPANLDEEINITYRLYMWISNNTVIGNNNQDYTFDEWNDVFASIKVSVTGDFNEKEVELEYEEKYNVTDASCFETEVKKIYTHNKNMTNEEIAICVNHFSSNEYNSLDEGEDWESFCKGTGTWWFETFDHMLYAENISTDDLIFLEENNIINSYVGISITDYDKSCGNEVVIPREIGEFQVLKIGEEAFRFKDTITSVVIPETVKSIGRFAFSSNSIDTLVLSEGIQGIYYNAFSNNNLKNVTIPNSVTFLDCITFDDDVIIQKNEELTCNQSPG